MLVLAKAQEFWVVPGRAGQAGLLMARYTHGYATRHMYKVVGMNMLTHRMDLLN
jgi:hypothetical protein